MTPGETLRAFWAAMETNDFSAAALFLTADVVIDMPQSGERICGRENFVAINTHYPADGPWRFNVLSLVEQGEKVVTVTDVAGAELAARVVSFSRIDPETGLIAGMTEYWPEPYSAPPWREAYGEKMPKEAKPMTGSQC